MDSPDEPEPSETASSSNHKTALPPLFLKRKQRTVSASEQAVAAVEQFSIPKTALPSLDVENRDPKKARLSSHTTKVPRYLEQTHSDDLVINRPRPTFKPHLPRYRNTVCKLSCVFRSSSNSKIDAIDKNSLGGLNSIKVSRSQVVVVRNFHARN